MPSVSNSTETQDSAEIRSSESPCCTDDCCGGTGAAKKAKAVSTAAVLPAEERLKEDVRRLYARVATEKTGCCGTDPVLGGCCGGSATEGTREEAFSFGQDYKPLAGYLPDADLGLGCGLPTQFAGIREGDTVIDLGCGAGNDLFVARAQAGASGKLIGVDFTPEMLAKARENQRKMGHVNMDFRLGEIENLPVRDGEADVLISNCVLNLVPDKGRAFAEMFRVLRGGGHFTVSDIVIEGFLPDHLRRIAEVYGGCVGGAIAKSSYLELLAAAGFSQVRILSEREIVLPDEILDQYIGFEEKQELRSRGLRLLSVTVTGQK